MTLTSLTSLTALRKMLRRPQRSRSDSRSALRSDSRSALRSAPRSGARAGPRRRRRRCSCGLAQLQLQLRLHLKTRGARSCGCTRVTCPALVTCRSEPSYAPVVRRSHALSTQRSLPVRSILRTKSNANSRALDMSWGWLPWVQADCTNGCTTPAPRH